MAQGLDRARIVLAVAVVAVAAGVVAGARAWRRKAGGPLRFYGYVDVREVRLAFEVAGRVAAVGVEEGDAVTNGQVLARLDPARATAALQAAEAELAARRARLARLEAGSRPEEIGLARAQVRAAEALASDAAQRSRRVREMAEKDFASAQQRDEAGAALQAAEARAEAERQALELATKGPRAEDVAAAAAEVRAAAARHALALRDFADTELKAPADAVVQSRVLEPGDLAAPQAVALTLARTDPVWVRAYVPEPDLGRVAPGLRVEVRSDSFPGKAYAGQVGFVSPVAEFTPKQVETEELRTRLVYQVRIHVPNPANELRLGMPVTVLVPPASRGGRGGSDAAAGP